MDAVIVLQRVASHWAASRDWVDYALALSREFLSGRRAPAVRRCSPTSSMPVVIRLDGQAGGWKSVAGIRHRCPFGSSRLRALTLAINVDRRCQPSYEQLTRLSTAVGVSLCSASEVCSELPDGALSTPCIRWSPAHSSEVQRAVARFAGCSNQAATFFLMLYTAHPINYALAISSCASLGVAARAPGNDRAVARAAAARQAVTAPSGLSRGAGGL